MDIIFILNTLGQTGGVKVVFEHANQLQHRGHNVTVIHLLRLKKGFNGFLIGLLKKFKYLLLKTINRDKIINWFSLNKNINILRLISLNKVKDFDVIIATANETADWVDKLICNKDKKFYFIQDYETWTRDKDEVDATYKLPLRKIVISSWLKKLLKERFNQKVEAIVFDGVNFRDYYAKYKVYNKNKKILMQYHNLSHKGIKYGIKAFLKAKEKYPEIELIMFGLYQPPQSILDITTFYYQPDITKLKEIYHGSDIFIFPSTKEGFGLTPMEAMAAKCAVVAARAGGIPDYAIDQTTAIIVEPGSVEQIYKAIIDLIEDEDKLKNLANNACQHIRSFSWEKAAIKLEEVLINK